MIGDDLNQTILQVETDMRTERQLNSIRKRRSKFICVNDNVVNMTEEIKDALHEFYESFFPVPSQFEKGKMTDGTKEAVQLNRLGIVIVILGVVGLIVLWVFFQLIFLL